MNNMPVLWEVVVSSWSFDDNPKFWRCPTRDFGTSFPGCYCRGAQRRLSLAWTIQEYWRIFCGTGGRCPDCVAPSLSSISSRYVCRWAWNSASRVCGFASRIWSHTILIELRYRHLPRSLASARVGGPEDAGDQIIHAVVVPWRWDEPDPRVSPSPGHTVNDSEPCSGLAITCLAHARGLVHWWSRTTSPAGFPHFLRLRGRQ
ncbi:hypothetical protein EDC04DRAFT_2144359 [Pisolithus marmoratus]|nr:hypothetical protein EDC04DRAFT_2144359 [Pisolithus marmoratus]